MPKAGLLTERIEVQKLKANATANAAGHIDETSAANWEFVAFRWAQFVPRQSREFSRALAQHTTLDYLIRVRDDRTTRTLTPQMRVTWHDSTGDRTAYIASSVYRVDEMTLEFAATETR